MSGVAQAATFFIDATAGDDTRTAVTAQTEATPWKTLTRALAATELLDGDTVRVATGAYGAGEVFPLPVRNGITVAGAGPTATVISVPEGSSAAFRGTTSLNDSTVLRGFGLVFGGTTANSADGFQFEGSSITVSPTISSISVGPQFNRGVAYSINGDGDLGGAVQNSTFTGVQRGVDARTHNVNVALRVEGSTIDASGTAVRMVGTDGIFAFAPVVTGSTVSSDVASAVFMAASSATSVEFSPRITSNVVASDMNTGNHGLQGEVQNVGTMKGSSLVAGNTVTAKADGVAWWLDASTATVDVSARIVGNDVIAGRTGIAAGTDGVPLSTGKMDYEMTGNTVHSTNKGAYFYAGLYGTEVNGSWLVSGNSASSDAAPGGYGVGISLSASSNAQVLDVRLQDNVATNAHDMGAYVLNYGGQPDILVSGNTLVGNPGVGLLIYASSASSSWFAGDLGGGARTSPGLNSMTGNGAGNGPYGNFDLVNMTPDDAFARNNYWGSTVDPTAIDLRVSDDDELATQGAVDVTGALGAQPVADATVDAVIAVTTDTGPVGLSAGDTVRITATVHATGELGCAAAGVALSGPIDGATYVAGSAASPTGFPRPAQADATPAFALGWIPAQATATASWDATVDASSACAPVAVLVTASCAPAADVTGSGSKDRALATWYTDGDGDGFGDASQETCADDAAPEGTVADGGDCVDAEASIHPGATEIAGDGIDQDCDGQDTPETDTDTDADSDSDTDTDTDADTDSDADADTSCDDGGGAAGGGGCCKPDVDSSCAWIVLPFLPLLTLRRRSRR